MDDKTPIQTLSQQVSYSGPLPTSTELAGYEKALPGTAERLLVMAEKQAEHRMANDDKLIDKSLRFSGRGQIFSFVITLLALGAVCLCVVLSQPSAAIAPALIAIPSILSAFFSRKK
jgi:uncharacterized membrane protein